MFYIPRTQPYYHQPEYYPYGYPPRRATSGYDDYEHDDYVETKRREYLEALHQQQQHCEYERAVALENQRHRAQLAALAEREVLRKQGSPHQPRPLYGYEQPQVSTLEEPVRRRQPAPKSQPQPRRRLDDWQTRLLADLYGIPTGHIHLQNERERSDEEEAPELEEEKHEPPPTTLRGRPPRRPTRVPPTSKPQTQAHSQTARKPQQKPQKPQSESVRVWVTSPTNSESESDSPKRMQAVTAIAEISRTFDTLRKTFSFPAGPLERNLHSSTLRLAYNAQNSVVHAYENALSELLTKLDAVESCGFKAVRDARKELVVKIERELGELEKKAMEALGVGEAEGKVEEKVKETMDEEDVEKAVVEDVDMGDRPSIAPAETSEAPEASILEDEHMEVHESSQPQAESVLSAPASSNIPEPQTTVRTTEPVSVSESIGTSHPIVEEPPTTDLGNEQDDGR